MGGFTRFADMELTDEERYDTVLPIAMPDKARYPYGLRICLTQSELDKLGLDADCCVGDMIDLRAFAEVTSISKSDDAGGGPQCRIELQIQKLAIENEADEAPGDDG